MIKLVSIVVVVMAVFGTPVTTVVPPAGKCKDITPVRYDFNEVKAKYRFWQMIYVPDDEIFADIDDEIREIFGNSPNVDTVYNKIKSENHSEDRYAFKLTYGNDLVLYEEDTNENMKIFQFKWIPLAVANQSAILYYRCSDTGSFHIDTRYIAVPKGHKLSPDDEQMFLAEDKKHNFIGGLRKLQNIYA